MKLHSKPLFSGLLLMLALPFAAVSGQEDVGITEIDTAIGDVVHNR